jgi:hypothetical protein
MILQAVTLVVVTQFELLDHVACFGFAIERHYAKIWCPTLEFSYPIRNGRIRNDNKSRESVKFRDKVTQESSNLYRFSLVTQ